MGRSDMAGHRKNAPVDIQHMMQARLKLKAYGSQPAKELLLCRRPLCRRGENRGRMQRKRVFFLR